MIDFPLTPENRQTVADAFREVPRVDIAIDCVVAGTMGSVVVDDDCRPTAFRIAFPPFYYFAGDTDSAGGQALVLQQEADSLVMPSAAGWLEAFRAAHGPRLVAVERYRFGEKGLDRRHLVGLVTGSPYREALRPMDEALARRLTEEEEGVVDLSAFASVADFLENGGGFCLVEEGEVTGVAFSSLAHPEAIEVSIFVEPDYRQQGRATALGAALLETMLGRGKWPHWDAANAESVRLAQKLGYQLSGSYEAQWLVI